MGLKMMRFEDLIITRTDERPLSIFHSVWRLLNLSIKPNLPQQISWMNLSQWAWAKSVKWAWAKSITSLIYYMRTKAELSQFFWMSLSLSERAKSVASCLSLNQICWIEPEPKLSQIIKTDSRSKTVKWVKSLNEPEDSEMSHRTQWAWGKNLLHQSQPNSLNEHQPNLLHQPEPKLLDELSRFSTWVWVNSEPGIRDEMSRCPMLLSDRGAWVESSSSRDRQTVRQSDRVHSISINPPLLPLNL
jgi:hypothetical protein